MQSSEMVVNENTGAVGFVVREFGKGVPHEGLPVRCLSCGHLITKIQSWVATRSADGEYWIIRHGRVKCGK